MSLSLEMMVEIVKRISINAINTKNLLEMGRVIHADRKNDAVIDQLALLHKRLVEEIEAARAADEAAPRADEDRAASPSGQPSTPGN